VRRTRAFLLTAIATLALAAPGMASASSAGGHFAHPYFHVQPNASTSPTGLSPATIKSAYGFMTSATAGAGHTIAIVDAYDDPTAKADLDVFSGQYGLPVLPTCTSIAQTTPACFLKVNQTGGSTPPKVNTGWALEIALDIQWAHAIAPGARILLVEATSNSFANLLAAEDYAAAHADKVSNSWGGSESSGESSNDSHFVHTGTTFFVSSGDAGTPAEYPSASPNVVSVGGTTLHFNGSTFSSETGWTGSGGGCSAYETAFSGQSTGSVNCAGKRATPDISLDADPASGVSIYDSTRYQGQQGWFKIGGTSASSPMIAAHAAVLGYTGGPAGIYSLAGAAVRDITSGNNGASCLPGYDLVTGRGSWLG
jgi:subtilase family serine protease